MVVRFSGEKSNIFYLIATKLACKNYGGGGLRGYVQVTSADSDCRMKGIEGAGMVELVYVGGVLRMGGDSLLVPVWRPTRVTLY